MCYHCHRAEPELHELHHHGHGLSRGGVSQTGLSLRRRSRRLSSLWGTDAETFPLQTQTAAPTAKQSSTNFGQLSVRDHRRRAGKARVGGSRSTSRWGGGLALRVATFPRSGLVRQTIKSDPGIGGIATGATPTFCQIPWRQVNPRRDGPSTVAHDATTVRLLPEVGTTRS